MNSVIKKVRLELSIGCSHGPSTFYVPVFVSDAESDFSEGQLVEVIIRPLERPGE